MRTRWGFEDCEILIPISVRDKHAGAAADQLAVGSKARSREGTFTETLVCWGAGPPGVAKIEAVNASNADSRCDASVLRRRATRLAQRALQRWPLARPDGGLYGPGNDRLVKDSHDEYKNCEHIG